jgi:hypothetical protein
VLTSAAVVPDSEKPNQDKHEHSHGWRHSEQIANLLKSYDRSVRPTFGGPATNIEVTMFFNQAKWSKNELNSIFYLRQTWTDARLAAEPSSKVDSRVFDAGEIIPYIWKPDTYFPGSVSKTVLENGFVRITKDGNVTWSQQLKLKTTCRIEVPSVAHNDGKTNCSLDMESYGFSTTDVTYSWKQPNDQAVKFDQDATYVTDHQVSTKETVLSTGAYSRMQIRIVVQTKFRLEVMKYLAAKLIEEN